MWSSQLTVALTSNIGNAANLQLVVIPTTLEAALADVQLAQSLPYAKQLLIMASGSAKANTLIQKMDTKTIYGLSQTQMQSDANFTGLGTTNPAYSWWWNILTTGFANANQIINILVRCNYHVEFFDPVGNEPDT